VSRKSTEKSKELLQTSHFQKRLVVKRSNQLLEPSADKGILHSAGTIGQEAMQRQPQNLSEPRRAWWRKQQAVTYSSLILCTAAGGPPFQRELRAASAAVNSLTTF
jgi:hypothetical protein